MTRRRRLAVALSVFLVPLALIALSRPSPAAACTGEPVSIDRIVRTAEAIVVARIVEVGPEVAADIAGSWTFAVEEVVFGRPASRFTLTWPTSVAACEGFVGWAGDRLVMALSVRAFEQPMYPFWLVETARPAGSHPGAREDLADLEVRLRRSIPSPAPSTASDAGVPILPLVLVALFGLVATAAFIEPRIRGQRGGL